MQIRLQQMSLTAWELRCWDMQNRFHPNISKWKNKRKKIFNYHLTVEGRGLFFYIRELTDNIPNWEYYIQLGISNPQLGIISHWEFGIYEYGNAESENKSPIPNWIKYHKLGI